MGRAYSKEKYSDIDIKKQLTFVNVLQHSSTTVDERNNSRDESFKQILMNSPKAYGNVLVSKASIELADQYHDQAELRNQNNFDIFVNNSFNGYGLQEVVENQLLAINSCMIKRPEPKAVELWIRLSAFAHWAADRDLVYWMMTCDSTRWSDTVALVGYATISTLNALDRMGLLRQNSPIRDLGYVLALLGDFLTKCFDVVGGIPWISRQCEACWPFKIVQYAKENGIIIHGIRDIETNFVEKYDDKILVNWWNRRPGVDRWGWSTKWRYMLRYHGNNGCSALLRTRRLGGDMFDISHMDEGE